jgi:hypothetical protein
LDEQIEKLEHGLMICEATGTKLVHIEKSDAVKILGLLKDREPVRAGKKIKTGDVVLDFYQCGHCKNAIRKPWRYCPFCGLAVKWD